MHARRASTTVLIALLVATTAACGDTTRDVANPTTARRSSPDPKINPTVFPSKSPSAAPTSAAPEPTESATGTPATSAPAGDGNTVEATATNEFLPPTLTVKVGTKVTWTNPAQGFHTVTGGTPAAKDTSTINGPLSFTTYEVTFTKAGTYKYFCEPHAPAMAGEIVVT